MSDALLTGLPVSLCCLVAIVQPLVPLWVVVALITPALVLMYIQLMRLQGRWEDVNEAVDLQEKWRRQRERAA